MSPKLCTTRKVRGNTGAVTSPSQRSGRVGKMEVMINPMFLAKKIKTEEEKVLYLVF